MNAARQQVIDDLRAAAPKGCQVGVIVRRTLNQNKSRIMSFLTFQWKDDGKFTVKQLDTNVYSLLCEDLALKRTDEGVWVGGSGLDMGRFMVSSIAIALYGHDDALEMVAL